MSYTPFPQNSVNCPLLQSPSQQFMAQKLLFIAFAGLVLGSCNTKQPTEDTSVSVHEPGLVDVKLSQLASDKDFICGMQVVEGSIADTASFDGKLYGFCSTECKDLFVTKPADYLAQP